MGNAAIDFDAVEKDFHSVDRDVRRANGILRATLALIEPDRRDFIKEYDTVLDLMDLCQSLTSEAVHRIGSCEAAYNGLECRVRSDPQPGDAISPEIVSNLLSTALAADCDVSWYRSAVARGNTLIVMAQTHAVLKGVVTEWLNLIRQHGGDARLFQYQDGTVEMTYNGILEEKGGV